MADLPGLIEGASGGAGLGTRFLGHVERCRVLVHLVDGTEADVARAYDTVRKEVETYGAGLAEKRELVALNKSDALTDVEKTEKQNRLEAVSGGEVAVISGVSGVGLEPLMGRLLAEIEAETADDGEARAFAP